MSWTPPVRLSVSKFSPSYDPESAKKIKAVYCDGALVPRCTYYDSVAGKARGKDEKGNWLDMVSGVITIELHDWVK